MPGAAKPEAMVDSGTFAFVFTDIEGSTSVWEAEPEAMKDRDIIEFAAGEVDALSAS